MLARVFAQDDGTEKDHFAAGGDDDPWWEDTFFDGSFSQASRGDDYRYGTTGSVSSEHLMGSMGQQVRCRTVLLLSHTPPALATVQLALTARAFAGRAQLFR